MHSRSSLLAAALALLALALLSCSSQAGRSADPVAPLEARESAGSVASESDWPQWRGPHRDAHAGAIVLRWPDTLARLWSVESYTGYASPVVADGVVYVHEQRDAQEVLRALRLEGGIALWQTDQQSVFDSITEGALAMLRPEPRRTQLGAGPYATPLVDRDVVYSFGFNGVLEGRRVSDGGLLCRLETDHPPPMHGSAMSPLLLDRGTVVVHLGRGSTGEVVAYSCERRAVVWSWQGDGAAYASPMLAEIDGSRQVIALTDRNAVGLDADSGELLWELSFSTRSNEGMITPLVSDDLVLLASVSRGTLALQPTRAGEGWEPRLVWQRPERTFFMSSPVLYEGMLVGLSDKRKGQLVALDAGNGEDRFVGEGRFAESASLVVVGEHLLVLTVEGELVVLDWHADSLSEVARYTVADTPVWAHLAVSGDVLVIRDSERLTAWRASDEVE